MLRLSLQSFRLVAVRAPKVNDDSRRHRASSVTLPIDITTGNRPIVARRVWPRAMYAPETTLNTPTNAKNTPNQSNSTTSAAAIDTPATSSNSVQRSNCQARRGGWDGKDGSGSG